jgi:hypothetical protein
LVLLAAIGLPNGNGVARAQAPNSNYPAIGHVYQIEFGALQFRNEYSADGKQMTFTRLSDGRGGIVHYTASEVRSNLFLNYWLEADGASVARVEDFEQGRVHAVVHFPDGNVLNLNGTLKKVD